MTFPPPILLQSDLLPAPPQDYGYAVALLAGLLGLALFAVGYLFRENTKLQKQAVDTAKEATKELITTLNEVKEQYKDMQAQAREHTKAVEMLTRAIERMESRIK